MADINLRPRIELQGIDDRSGGTVPLEPEQLPQHLPVMFLHTEKAEDVTIASAELIREKYGAATLDPASGFYNHQHVMAQHILSQGNQVMVVPVKMPDAKRATMRISVEIIPTTVVKDNIKKHVNRLVWHVEEIPEGGFAQGSSDTEYRNGATESELTGERLGVLLDSDGDEYTIDSIKLPIIDLQTPGRGSYGSRLGLILDAPHDFDAQTTDQTLAQRLYSYIYRLRLVERLPESVTHSVLYTKYATTTSDFVLTPNAVDNRTGTEVSLGDVIVNNYSVAQTSDTNGVISPFNQPAIYQDNIEALAYMLAAGHEIEAENIGAGGKKLFTIPGLFDNETEAMQKMYSTNILTGRDYSGTPYSNMLMDGAYLFDGVEFGKDSVVYAKGGTDGVPLNASGSIDKLETLRIFDEEVRRWCLEFDDTRPIFDSAVYPFSTLWDSGFSIETKLAMLSPMGKHKRIWVGLGTYSCADYIDDAKSKFGWMPELTAEQEIGIATRLSTAAHLYPESELFGTSVCRAIIVGYSGILRNEIYRRPLPLTHSLAYKVAGYCGAGNGYWKRVKAIDSERGRIDDLFKKVSITYQSDTGYDKSWRAGMNWVQYFDRDSVFFPAYQTVFKDSTSILDSLLTIIAASYIQRVGEITWRIMVNNNVIGKSKFLEKSDSEITKLTKNKFDGRFDIVPISEYTSTDNALGNHWTTVVEVYGDVPNLLNKFRLETYRRTTQ